MTRMNARIIVTALLTLVAGVAAAADEPTAATPSEPETPPSAEPIKCYRGVGRFDSGITVGLSIELCSGTTNAMATLSCFDEAYAPPAYGGLGLTRGQAIWLCRTAGASERQ